MLKLMIISLMGSIFLFLGCTSIEPEADPEQIMESKGLFTTSEIQQTLDRIDSLTVLQIKGRLENVETQLQTVDTLITTAQGRLQNFEMMNTPGREALIHSVEAEISSYEAQKFNLNALKSQLEVELTAKNEASL